MSDWLSFRLLAMTAVSRLVPAGTQDLEYELVLELGLVRIQRWCLHTQVVASGIRWLALGSGARVGPRICFPGELGLHLPSLFSGSVKPTGGSAGT